MTALAVMPPAPPTSSAPGQCLLRRDARCPAGTVRTQPVSIPAKLNAQADRVYSTFLSGIPNALQVDSRGNAYVARAYARRRQMPCSLARRTVRARDDDGGTTWRPAQDSKQPTCCAWPSRHAPVLYALHFTIGISKSTDLGDHWRWIDRGGFPRPVVAPSNPNVLYAVYDSPVHQLMHRSTDGGETWAFVETPIDGEVFAVDTQDPQTLYVGGPAGLFKSVNGGNAWTPARNGIDAQASVTALVVAPSNHNVLLATARFTAPSPRSELYRSVDGGANWTQTTSPTRPSNGPVAFDPLDATRVYATDGPHILRSTDGGVNWTSFAESNTSCRAIAVTRTPDPTVFGVCQDGVARAIDTGGPPPVALTVPLGNGCVHQIAVDPVDPRVLVAAAGPAGDGFLSVRSRGSAARTRAISAAATATASARCRSERAVLSRLPAEPGRGICRSSMRGFLSEAPTATIPSSR